jgi:hypothetical protein
MKTVMPSASDILKNFKKGTENGFKSVGPSLAEIEKKIEILKVEAAKQLAIETFLDCDYKKVKVSKRVKKSPRFALGYVH